MAYYSFDIYTKGEALYSITDAVEGGLEKLIKKEAKLSGILYAFVMHTSCALLISENYDPTAKNDLEHFFSYLAPRDLSFIQHTLEGKDDSPSHMKSSLLNQHLAFIVNEGEIILGQWQGVFLAEFRDQPKKRTVLLKFMQD